ncbi:flagellar export protein FliJ [Thermopetrobacter sp. TC1]|uniref:flagellar export protein FliJ n=1 Tax=Thermopetrobacter sp. TC1 TaxID=1495045 RepID=UPI0018CD293E|nr:flagellar export protein FliJ [Thermopetrobacter sp. TC1]
MRPKDWQARLRLHRFRVEEARRQVAEIELMISEFSRKKDELDECIRYEEERCGITDPKHVQYPPAALDMRRRRDNLVRSIDDLKEQLKVAVERAEEAERELERVEMLSEKAGEAPVIAGRGGRAQVGSRV